MEMEVTRWGLVLSMCMMGCLGSVGQTERGCMTWSQNGSNVCCEACFPGNRVVRPCGPRPADLCTPCEAGTFTTDPRRFSCEPCSQCVGALVQLRECAATRDTTCGCKEGLLCGDARCSFCVHKCDKGQEPTQKRSCRPCPHGTFNDRTHQMCKPWRTTCPRVGQYKAAEGTAFSDIACANITLGLSQKPQPPGADTEQTWPLVLSALSTVALTTVVVVIIISVAVIKVQRRRKRKMTVTDISIVRTITDEPLPLRAVECSFHEAQQEEQGGSSESLDTKDSTEQLIP